MNAFRVATLLVVSVLLTPVALLAQEDTLVLEPGARIRLLVPSIKSEEFVAFYEAVHGDTIVVDAELWQGDVWKPRLRVPLTEVTALEVCRERHSNAGKGALFGGLTGVGAVAAAALYGGGTWDGEVWARAAMVVGVATGVGALIGSLSHKEVWEAVPLDGLRIEPSRHTTDGVSVSVSLRL